MTASQSGSAGPAGFRFSLPLTLAAAALIALFVSLGNWQLQRADYKRTLMDARRARAQAPAMLALPAVATAADEEQSAGYPVRLQGSYDNALHLLLQNQVMDGTPGAHVYTAFRPDGRNDAVLVNRGWIAVTPGRLPDVELAADATAVTGTLRVLPRAGYDFGAATETVSIGGSRVLPTASIDPAALAGELGALYPMVLFLAPEAPQGFGRDWPPIPGSAARHEAYAAQWFIFAALTALFYVLLSRRRKQ